jgi:hypothetical protein
MHQQKQQLGATCGTPKHQSPNLSGTLVGFARDSKGVSRQRSSVTFRLQLDCRTVVNSHVSMLQPASRFFLIGLAVAVLEEFITQGVLKKNLGGWFIPTLIAFVPFLFIMRVAGKWFDRRYPPPQATLRYYLLAGAIGLAVEWFLIGLTPWSNPQANPLMMLIFQLGMFSFWIGVAFAPRLLLDTRESVARLRLRFRKALLFGMLFIYVITFLAKGKARFPLSIASVMFTFILLNLFYLQYYRALRRENEHV